MFVESAEKREVREAISQLDQQIAEFWKLHDDGVTGHIYSNLSNKKLSKLVANRSKLVMQLIEM